MISATFLYQSLMSINFSLFSFKEDFSYSTLLPLKSSQSLISITSVTISVCSTQEYDKFFKDTQGWMCSSMEQGLLACKRPCVQSLAHVHIRKII